MAIKRVFITGAGGFLGSALVRFFLANHWQVIGLTRRDPPRVGTNHLEWVTGDIRSGQWHRHVAGCQVFIHAAGVHGYLRVPWRRRLSVEVDGMKSVITAAQKWHIPKIIMVGTAYQDFSTDYARAKRIAQQLLEREMRKGFPAAIICPVIVYGPGDLGNFFRVFDAVRRRTFFFVGSGKTPVWLLYIDDFVAGCALILNKWQQAKGKSWVLGPASSISWQTLVQDIAAAEGVAAPTIHLPVVPMNLVGSLFSWGMCLGLPVPFTRDTIVNLTAHHVFDSKTTRDRFGFVPRVPLSVGIRKTVASLFYN